MKKTLLAALLVSATAVASAAPVITIAEGVTGATGDAAFATLTTAPVPSSTDAINGITATGIEVTYPGFNSGNPAIWPRHNDLPGGNLNYALFTDGSANTTYPDQLPADFFPGGNPGPLNNPPTRMFWALPAAADLMSFNVYAFNSGNDCRACVNFDVYATTDATPTAGGAWTKLNSAILYPSAAPKSMTYLSNNSDSGIAHIFADNTGAPLASSITGIRLDVYGSGFGNELRDPVVDGGGGATTAVTTPFLGEFDAITAPSNVGEWTMY